MLYITARRGYTDYAERLRAKFEFATAPDEKAIVRTLKLDNKPGTVAVFLPPNLLTPENLALLKTDGEIASAIGQRLMLPAFVASCFPAFSHFPSLPPAFQPAHNRTSPAHSVGVSAISLMDFISRPFASFAGSPFALPAAGPFFAPGKCSRLGGCKESL